MAGENRRVVVEPSRSAARLHPALAEQGLEQPSWRGAGPDGRAHRHRKAMLLSLKAAERVDDLSALLAAHLRDRTADRAAAGRVVLYDEVRELLTRAVCAWSGVPLAESDVRRRTGELTARTRPTSAASPKHGTSTRRRSRTTRRPPTRWTSSAAARSHTSGSAAPRASSGR
ncbi:hypothetical protein [Streptomyces sp. B5E4]|uniref:hypothetical protein n=1 Tax=Streptomyces sp. B5E4 TaxID=3153568 RepID=UPI00325DD4DC